jgi:large subunit ribosomal protein L2
MAIKHHKPTTAGRRKSSAQDFSDITSTKPEKTLVRRIQRKSGRNNTGRITVRHQAGGAKQLYRIVDFVQNKFDVPATVKTIEYDPNRGCRICLVEYTDGTKAYILGYNGVKVGDVVVSSMKKIDPAQGSRMPLEHIPVGVFVYNVELAQGQGGKLVRGAGNSAQLQVIEGEYAQLKMPSGEIRLVKKQCMASIGAIGNSDYNLVRYGKAGRMRLRGIKPRVKGKNMNPVDHPHGGGEGHSPIGLRGGPKTMWGKKAMGVKTRKRGKWSDAFIVSRRKGRK